MKNETASSAKGFTLVEMLVALVITSMLVTLITGAFYYVLQVREKLRTELEHGAVATRTQSWFETVVRGCVPIKANQDGVFSGDGRGFRAFTQGALSPLAVVPPVLVELVLKEDEKGIRLEYKEGRNVAVLAHWLNADGKFRYYDEQGEGQDHWNVISGARRGLLPRLIQLEVTTQAGRELYLAAIEAGGWINAPSDLAF